MNWPKRYDPSAVESRLQAFWQENGVTIVIAGTLNPDQAQAIAGSLQ